MAAARTLAHVLCSWLCAAPYTVHYRGELLVMCSHLLFTWYYIVVRKGPGRAPEYLNWRNILIGL